MNHPRLNCYYIDLNYSLETNTKYLKMRVKENLLTIKYGTWLFGNEIGTDIDIQIDIFHRSLTLIYSHSQFIPGGWWIINKKGSFFLGC